MENRSRQARAINQPRDDIVVSQFAGDWRDSAAFVYVPRDSRDSSRACTFIRSSTRAEARDEEEKDEARRMRSGVKSPRPSRRRNATLDVRDLKSRLQIESPANR